MPKYTALTPIEHDGKPYAEGEPITLTEDQAAPLLALKAVEPAAGRAKAKPEGEADAKPDGDNPQA